MTKDVHIWRLASKQQTNTVSRHREGEGRPVGRKKRRISFNLPSSDICHQHVSFRRQFPSAQGSCCAYLISSYFLSSEIIDFSFPLWILSSFFLSSLLILSLPVGMIYLCKFILRVICFEYMFLLWIHCNYESHRCTVHFVKPLQLLTLCLLMWKIWRAPNNGREWQMGFNSAFKELTNKWTYITFA